MRFFVGLHQPSDAKHFGAVFISVSRLRKRKSGFSVGDWILDSGAFTEVSKYGGYRYSVEEYASHIRRFAKNGNLLAAVSQDWMCEPKIINGSPGEGIVGTGLSVAEHQRLTVERYDALLACETGVYIMPVLQGYEPEEYVSHIEQYGDRLKPGMWVGVGSVCKRNGDPRAIERVLLAVHSRRPDLKLHGFGLKKTALSSGLVRRLLETADSQAWSAHERRQKTGRANDWRAAREYVDAVEAQAVQWPLFLARANLPEAEARAA